MKAIIFSDSHGQTDAMIDIVAKNNDVHKIIHLGDLVKDAERLEYEYPNIEIIRVAGNNDWYSNEPTERLIELSNKKTLITHGNFYGVKNGLSKVLGRSKELGAEVVLFGHTHIPHESYEQNVLLINPGSISLPAGASKPSYCILEIKSETLTTNFFRI
ncbi:MAG: YfcE family phosphodiesterase [Ignavibacteriales bacterium]